VKRIALALLVLLAAARAARAEDVATYETDGSAASSLSDARTRALDVAFAAAVGKSLEDLVAPADLTSFRGDLDRVIVARARLYVASFKVTSEDTRGDELHVSAAVKIDRDRVRAKLTELGVPMKSGGATAPTAPANAPKAVVLLRVETPTGVIADYGAAAVDTVPGLEGIGGVLRTAGVAVVTAPRSGPAAHGGGELPLDDDSARALAGDARAGMVVIVGVTIEGAGAVRGARAEGASAIAHVRILEGDRLSGEGVARAGAYSSEDAGAITRAATTAAVGAVSAAMPKAADGAVAPPAPPPPPLVAPDGAVLVRLRGLTVWTPIKSITAQLSQTSGVDKIVMMRVAAGEVVLAVTTKQKPERIAAAIRATEGFTGRAATDDGVVEVTP
jgi:hypothetical protein